MSLANRYTPSHPAGSTATYGFDYSPILEPGSTIASASLAVEYNTAPPAPQGDFTVAALLIAGRRLYAALSGGTAGRDYRVTWVATDDAGNSWPRTVLLRCAQTS